MKYQNEFDKSKNKEEFIKLVLKKYPKIKYITAKRRYYDYYKILKYKYDEKEELTILHKILLADAKKYNIKITKEFLFRYGFTQYEINWLEDKQQLEESDE